MQIQGQSKLNHFLSTKTTEMIKSTLLVFLSFFTTDFEPEGFEPLT